MKTYQVILTKSYVITINAETNSQARQACEFYTNDVQDISTSKIKRKEKFSIENIECTVNEACECQEVEAEIL